MKILCKENHEELESLQRIRDTSDILLEYIGDSPFCAAEMIRRYRSGESDTPPVLAIIALSKMGSLLGQRD